MSVADGTMQKAFLNIWAFKFLLKAHLWRRNSWFPHWKELLTPLMNESQASALNSAGFIQSVFLEPHLDRIKGNTNCVHNNSINETNLIP